MIDRVKYTSSRAFSSSSMYFFLSLILILMTDYRSLHRPRFIRRCHNSMPSFCETPGTTQREEGSKLELFLPASQPVKRFRPRERSCAEQIVRLSRRRHGLVLVCLHRQMLSIHSALAKAVRQCQNRHTHTLSRTVKK